MSKAEISVLALARAMYGKRMTEIQYCDLMSMKSINEIASYLRTRTEYKDAFVGSMSGDFSAKQLNDVVKKHCYNNFDSLYRYELSIGQKFYKYFVAKIEIQQILRCTMLIMNGKKDKYMMDFNSFLDKHLDVDLFALGKADTLQQVLAALEHTQYEKIYEKCLSTHGYTYLTFETALSKLFLNYQNELIEKTFNAQEKKAVMQAMCRMADLNFVEKLIRTVKYYGGDDVVMTELSMDEMTLFKKSEIKALIACKTVEEISNVLKTTVYKSCADFGEVRTVNKHFREYLYSYYKKQIRFSSFPCVVMFCYIFLAENEAMNIIRIIEGNKYAIPQEEIKRSLIGVGD